MMSVKVNSSDNYSNETKVKRVSALLKWTVQQQQQQQEPIQQALGIFYWKKIQPAVSQIIVFWKHPRSKRIPRRLLIKLKPFQGQLPTKFETIFASRKVYPTTQSQKKPYPNQAPAFKAGYDDDDDDEDDDDRDMGRGRASLTIFLFFWLDFKPTTEYRQQKLIMKHENFITERK